MTGKSKQKLRYFSTIVFFLCRLPSTSAQLSSPVIAGGISLELASVRPSAPGQSVDERKVRPDGVMQKNGLLYYTVLAAFGIQDDRGLIGLPEWTEDERFDIVAKIAEGDTERYAKLPLEQQLQLLQLVLTERFGLKTHTETRVLPVWALVVSKGGSKLTPATGKSDAGEKLLWRVTGNYTLTAKNATMKDLCRMNLTTEAQQYTVDQTGLDGRYDFTLSWSRPGQEETAESPEIFQAVKDQLGLQLIKRDLPETVVVVDEIHRPTPN